MDLSCVRRPGGRYEYTDSRFRTLRQIHGLLENLHDFQQQVQQGGDGEAVFPQEDLEAVFHLLKQPSIFGGALGLPGPPAPRKQDGRPQESGIKDDKLDVNMEVKGDQSVHIAKAHQEVQVLAETFNLHERVAANYWLDAREPAKLHQICHHYGYASNYFDDKRQSAAEHLYCMERSHLLDVVITLMSLRVHRHKDVGRFTNKLLHHEHGNIIKVLLDVLKTDSGQLTEKTAGSTTNYLQKVALAVFHSCHQLQMNEADEKLLLEVIKHVSKEIVDDDAHPDAGDGSLFVINIGLPPALVVLQLTYIHITREEGFVTVTDVDTHDGILVLDNAVPNSLLASIKKRSDDDEEESFSMLPSCLGVHGLIDLTHARMMHYPCVGAEPFMLPNPSYSTKMVLERFHQANERRAYSHIRLCLLPVLQSMRSLNDFSSQASLALLTKVFKEFMWELSVIFLDSEYQSRENALDRQSSSPFFRLAPERLDQPPQRPVWGAGAAAAAAVPAAASTGINDCFTDITLLYTAFIAAYPSFAIQYIRNLSGKPFVEKVLYACGAPAMQVPAMRLLAQLANTPFKVSEQPGGSDGAAKRVYDLVKHNAPVDLKWAYLANDRLWRYVKRFRKVQDDPNAAAGNMFSNVSTWSELDRGHVGGFSQEASEITADVEEEIVAIAGLFAAVYSQPRLLQIDDATGPMLVGTLFQLIACPLSIAAKGSLFRALAAYARNCDDLYASEVWKLLIEYKLLPNMDEYAATTGSIDPKDYARQDLRSELQDTESRAGEFFITDGFLILLEALLSHGLPHSYASAPNPVAKNVIVYLHYVIDDVLANAETRYYNDSPPHPSIASRKSSAQKWRIYARSFKLLSTVLQHYGINQLGGVLGPTFDATALRSLEDDFREDDAVPGNLGGSLGSVNPASRLVRSPGFMVMAMMLGKSKNGLQKSLAHVLENSGLEMVEETDTLSKFWAAHGAVKTMCDTRTSNLEGRVDKHIACEDLHLRGIHDGVCEGSYWHVKAISAATGLLYECSLRERVFLERMHASPQISVAVVRRATLVAESVKGQSLGQVFGQYAVLDRLAMLLCFPSSLCASVPSVPIMASHIVKAACLEMPGAFALQSKDDSLMLGCCRTLVQGERPLGGQVFPDMYAVGADMLPDIYADQARARLPCEAPDIARVLEVVKAAKREGSVSELENFESPRDALLDFLVTTLAPEKPCFAHKLLGLHGALLYNKFKDDPLRAGEKVPIRGSFPTSCLDATLHIMQDIDLITESPDQAVLCYELVYRLCASPATNLIVLGHLRKDRVRFIKRHLEISMDMLRLSDAQILDRSHLPPDDVAARSIDAVNDCISRVKSARLNCCAWLLKTCALECRALHMSGVAVQSLVDGILQPLFGVMVQGRRGDHITLMSMLLAAADIPDVSFLQFSTPMKRKISEASTMYAIGRGSAGRNGLHAKVVDKFVFSRLCKRECDQAFMPGVFGPAPIKQDEYEDTLKNITLLNKYIQHVAAARNLCEGWNQCIGMALCCHKIDSSRLVTSLVLPTLQVINSQDKLEAEMPEFLASAIFSMISVLYRETSASGQAAVQLGGEPQRITSILDTDQHRGLLSGLIKAAVHSMHREEPSIRYRGYLVQSIGLVLTGLSGFSVPLVVVSPSLREAIGDEEQAVNSGHWGGLRDEDSETYRAQAMHLLEHHATALVDSVSRDACNGPIFLRLSALSTLQATLSVLGPAKSSDLCHLSAGQSAGRFKHVLGSHAFLQALRVLVERGYLQQMLSIVGPVTGVRAGLGSGGAASAAAVGGEADGLDEMDERELFITTASLCIQISCAAEGVDALIHHGSLLQRLLSLPDFLHPPPGRDDIVPAATQAPCSEDWEDSFLVVLRLLRTIAATCPTRFVLEACAEFLRRNHASVSYLLRLKHKNLYGMALLEAVLAVIAFVAAAPTVPLRRAEHFNEGDRVEVRGARMHVQWRIGRIARDGKDGTFDIEYDDGLAEQRVAEDAIRHCSADPSTAGILWDEALGKLANSFTADVCGLLQILGSWTLSINVGFLSKSMLIFSRAYPSPFPPTLTPFYPRRLFPVPLAALYTDGRGRHGHVVGPHSAQRCRRRQHDSRAVFADHACTWPGLAGYDAALDAIRCG